MQYQVSFCMKYDTFTRENNMLLWLLFDDAYFY